MSNDELDPFGWPLAQSEVLYLRRRHKYDAADFWRRRSKAVEEQRRAQCQDGAAVKSYRSTPDPEAGK